MADAGRLTPHNKPNQNGDAAADAQRAKQGPDADKPGLKVTFERPETREALKSAAHVALVPEPAPANSYGTEPAKSTEAKPGLAVSLLDKPEKSADSKAHERRDTETREVYKPPQLLSTPLLAVVAAVATLAAGWSYMKLTEARKQLTTVNEAIAAATAEKAAATEAKVTAEKAIAAAQAEMTTATQLKTSAEKALTEAQTRISTMESTVAEIKAALAAVIASTSSAPVTPAKDGAPPAPEPAK